MPPAELPQTPEITPTEAHRLVELARGAAAARDPGKVVDARERLEFRIVACNRYLRQLAEWSKRGLLTEVASVNQAFPQLCQVASTLAMPDVRPTWDAACQAAGVATNTEIDLDACQAVADAVGDADSMEEHVQRFQLAVLARRSLGTRIRYLRDLLDAAPRNPALKDLAKRYQSEALSSLESTCRTAASRGDMKTLNDALEAIDGLGWRAELSRDFCTWLEFELTSDRRKSAEREHSALAARIRAAHAARDLVLMGTLVEQVEGLERDNGVPPGDEFRMLTREPLAWYDQELGRLRRESAHESACERLRAALDAGRPSRELEAARGEIEATGLGVPEYLKHRMNEALERERRRRAWRTVAIAGAGVVIAAGAAAIVVWVFG